jgi:hypothetical protein
VQDEGICFHMGDEFSNNFVCSCVGLVGCGIANFVECVRYGAGECCWYWVS